MSVTVEETEEFHDCSDQLTTPADDVINNIDPVSAEPSSSSSMSISEIQNEGSAEEDQPTRNEYYVDEAYLAQICELFTEEQSAEHKEKAIQLKADGNRYFTENSYEEAAKIYTKALCTCPIAFNDLRAILYSNRAACFAKMEQNDEAIADCSKAVELDSTFTKAFMRRAQLYEQKDENFDKALEDYKSVLKKEPNNKIARDAVARLPILIAERNEKMKNEMIDKLKDLGNLVLRPFGLSTDNFKLEPQEGGGYSVKIQK